MRRSTITRPPLNEADFIADPDRWPRWPVLPLRKRQGGGTEPDYLGFLVDGHPPTTLFVGCIFDKSRPAAEMERVEFGSVPDLLRAYQID